MLLIVSESYIYVMSSDFYNNSNQSMWIPRIQKFLKLANEHEVISAEMKKIIRQKLFIKAILIGVF